MPAGVSHHRGIARFIQNHGQAIIMFTQNRHNIIQAGTQIHNLQVQQRKNITNLQGRIQIPGAIRNLPGRIQKVILHLRGQAAVILHQEVLVAASLILHPRDQVRVAVGPILPLHVRVPVLVVAGHDLHQQEVQEEEGNLFNHELKFEH